MSIASWVIRRIVRRRLRQVAETLRDPVGTQERLLRDLVRRAARTEWGREHDYAAIRTVGDFQQAVPITCYEDMAPLWERSFAGEGNLSWPGRIRYFATSSGTTTGITKLLPVSRDAVRANIRAGAQLLGLCERQAPGLDTSAGRTLYFGSPICLKRNGACWQGDGSGIMAAHLPRVAWLHRLPERGVAAMSDWEQKVETVCHRYQDSPVRAIAGLPMWSLILLRRLIDVARKHRHVETVSEIWPELRVFIYFGTGIDPYREQFRTLFGDGVVNVGTYSSSEGGMNAIQSGPGDEGMQLVLDAGAFYEFVPIAELHSDRPTRLTLRDVEVGAEYALLLSTVSGCWAYDVGDIIRFTSLDPPTIVVAGRTRLALNVFGEHLIRQELDDAVATAERALGAAVRDFTVAPLPLSADAPRGGHRWLIEFEGDAPSPAAMLEHVDAHLKQINADYAKYRTNDFALAPPEGVALAPGTFYEWTKRHHRLGGQTKIPRVARDTEMVDELLELSHTLENRAT